MILNKGNTQTLVNNNGKIDYNNTNWNASYDGKIADIDVTTNTNGKKDLFLIQLDNNDLQKIFSTPSDNLTIDQRLLKDYPHSTSHRIKKNKNHKTKKVRFRTPTHYPNSFVNNEIISPRTNEIFVFENNSKNSKRTKTKNKTNKNKKIKLGRRFKYKHTKKPKTKTKTKRLSL